MVAQDYIRKSFRCLQLANYALRPTPETAETLFILAQETANEYQPGLSWFILGAASRIVQLREMVSSPYDTTSPNQYDHPSATPGGINPDHAVSIAIALQDAIFSLILRKATPHHLAQLKQYGPEAPRLGIDITVVLIDVYAAIPDPIWSLSPRDTRWSPPPIRLWPEALQSFHNAIDAVTRGFRLADLAACKSIRDRYEHHTFRLHVSYAVATVQRAALPERLLSPETQESSAGRRLEMALLDILRSFIDFSAISNLPVRSWWMIYFALEASLELCSCAQAREGPFVTQLLPRFLTVVEAGAPGGLGKREQESLAFMGRVLLEWEKGERGNNCVVPEEARRELLGYKMALGLGDGKYNALALWVVGQY